MRIALAQIDTTVGAFERNLERLRRPAQEAAERGARLLVAPELTVTGYPPRDFLELAAFVDGARRATEAFCASELPRGLALAIGTVEAHAEEGAGLYNAAWLVDGGRVVAQARKSLLPTYDVFDEGRWFDPAPAPTLVELDGVRLALTVCEDLWNDEGFWAKRRYHEDPVETLVARGAQLVLNLSASPYALGKPQLRERMLSSIAKRHGVPIALCNLVGGNDALVFDGRSLAIDAEGRTVAAGRGFAEDLVVVDLAPGTPRTQAVEPTPPRTGRRARGEASLLLTPTADETRPAQLDELFDALVLGTRDYAQKTGFQGAVLGLSGGIDSALVAVVAAHAFGPDRVHAVSMPSRFTADMSNDDAAVLAANLGIHYRTISIEKPFAAYLDALAPSFEGRGWDVTEENLQARARGATLMALSNKLGLLLLTTGNKSELATGYCTLYGDMCGGLAVIGDVPKTLVWALSRRINEVAGREVIPARTIDRPPSAELRPNQTDQDSLPPYEVLDRVLRRYVEAREAPDEIARAEPDIPRATIDRIVKLVLGSEYKRRQAAPVLRVTPRAFGEGWRFPIAHGWR